MKLTILRWLILALLIFALLFSIGVSSKKQTNTETTELRRIVRVFFPFGFHGQGKTIVIWEKYNYSSSAVSLFLRDHSIQREANDEVRWFTDQYREYNLLGFSYSFTMIRPGKYRIFNSYNNKALLLDFLQLRYSKDPTILKDILRYLDAPCSEWSVQWRKDIQVAYYDYYLTRYLE